MTEHHYDIEKKPSLATLAVVGALAFALLLAVSLTATAAPPTPEVGLLASGPNGLTFEVAVAEPQPKSMAAGLATLQPVSLDGYVPGPDGLPIRDLLIALPPSGDAHLSVEPLTAPRTLQGPPPVTLAPRIPEEQGFIGAAGQPVWEPVLLPDQPVIPPLATLTEQGFFRQWRIARLRLSPVAYLGNGQWQLVPNFRVSVSFDEPSATAQAPSDDLLAGLVEKTLLNGQQALTWAPANAPIQAASVTNLPATTWRIPISADGLYRLSYDALDEASVPVLGTAPAAYHLFWGNQEIPLQGLGIADGSFDPGDSFVFYGQKFHGSVQDEKYTDENVYWLTIDTLTPGLRMASRSVEPTGSLTAVTWYTATVRTEQNLVYWSRWTTKPGTDTTWFWQRIRARTTEAPQTRHYPITLNKLAPATYKAVLRVEVAGESSSAANPDHHILISVNNHQIREEYWDGMVGRVIVVPFDSAWLVEGANDIAVTVLNDVGTQIIYFDFAELSFRRQLSAQGDQLNFNALPTGPAAFTVTGFTDAKLRLYDISSPLATAVLTDSSTIANGPAWDLLFHDTPAVGQRYLALTRDQIVDAPSVSLYYPRLELLSSTTGADEIIITPTAFEPAALQLATLRQGQGLRVQVVRTEDIYPLFNGGVIHPQAIRDFLAYAYQTWDLDRPRPAFALLLGDGHYNPKGYNPASYGAPAPVYIPPFLAFLDPWQGEVPVDTRFAQIVGTDTLPDLAIGRINANSLQDATSAVAKILAYESEPTPAWLDDLLFVADNIPDSAGDFEGALEGLISSYVPASYQLHRVYLTSFCGAPTDPTTPCPSATEALTQTWSQGAAMITFMGHGAVQRWTHEPLLLNTQVDTLQPGHGLPFVVTLNCLDGYFMLPPNATGSSDPRGMAEAMVMAPDYGSIANFSPTGLGTVFSERQIANRVYDAIFNDGVRRLGDLALAGQLTPVSYPPHITQVSTLFGDPAGSLRLLSGPTAVTLASFKARPGYGAVQPLWLGTIGILLAGATVGYLALQRRGQHRS